MTDEELDALAESVKFGHEAWEWAHLPERQLKQIRLLVQRAKDANRLEREATRTTYAGPSCQWSDCSRLAVSGGACVEHQDRQ